MALLYNSQPLVLVPMCQNIYLLKPKLLQTDFAKLINKVLRLKML